MAQSDTTTFRLFLDRLLMRSELTQEEQKAVLALPAHPVQIRKGQDFIQFKEQSTYSCLISSGVVVRFGQTSTGARQFTALHIPGDMVDLHSAVRPVGIGGLNALTASVVLRVPHTAIRALAARHPAVAEAFWRDCMLDAAVLMQWLVNVGRHDARTRLAHLFCEMAIRSGPDREPSLTYDLPLTQEQLGDAAGLTSVHVNRVLKGIAEFVSSKGGKVTIHDWTALVQIGDFDPTYLTADTGRHLQTSQPRPC